MSVVGAIEIQMLADLARLRMDMDSAKNIVGNAVNSIKGALGGMLAGLSVAAFGAWIKGAINAADEAHNLGQRVGIATKDLAGLQLAFKQAGVDGGGMQSAMVKLSKNVAEGDDVFKRMGVSVRNADGSFKNSKQVLYDVADVFAGMPDGINKTALATDVFGKAGAELVPMLNEGSTGLREMADMAERLGLVIDDDTAAAADSFNDTVELLGMGMDGMGRQVAAQLLPTLKGLAGTFLDTMTSGDKLRRGADILASGLKVLFTGGVIGVQVFSTLGKTLGGVAAAVVSAARGEFSEAWRILEESGRDIGRGWGDAAATIESAWTGAGTETVDQAVKITKGLKGSTVATKEQADATKKAREEQEKLAKAGQDYLLGLNEQYGAMQRQISLGRDLTEGEKEIIKLEEQLAKGKISLTAAELESARAKLLDIDALKEQRRQQEDYLKTLASVAQHTSKWNDEQARATDTMRQANVQLIEENDKLRLGEAAWNARQRAVLLNQAADLEWQAANQGGNFQLEEQARLLRDRAQLLQDGTVLKEAKAAADEWKKTTDSINTGLTDALLRAFESGKGFWEAFRDTIVNAAKTLVLKPVIEFLVRPIGSAIGSIVGSLGMGGTAGATVGTGSAGGGLSLTDAATYYSAYKNLAGKFGAGYEALATSGIGQSMGLSALAEDAAGNTYLQMTQTGQSVGYYGGAAAGIVAGHYGGRAISDGYSTGGSGNATVNAGTAIGTVIGAYFGMPGVGAAIGGAAGGLVNRAFGRKKPELQGQGIDASFGGGDFTGNTFTDYSQKGGWFRSDRSWTDVGAVDKELADLLDVGAKAMFAQAKQYGEVLGLPVDQLASVVTKARVTLTGDAARDQEAIQKAVQDYADAMSGTFVGAITGATRAGESATDTLQRLGSSLLSVNGVFDTLGLRLLDSSVAGGKAASTIIDLTGGLDAFLAKTQGYLQAYFTDAEQYGITAKALREQLQAVGLDLDSATQRQDLRALMESIDPNDALGAQQAAALLNIAGDFAKVSGYLQDTGLTLAELAAQAPQSVGPLGAGASSADASTSTQLLQTANEHLTNVAGNTATATVQLESLVNLQAAANQALLDRLAQMQAVLDEALRPVYYQESTGA